MNLDGEPRQAATELLERVRNNEPAGTSLTTGFFSTSLAEWSKEAGLALHNTAPPIPRHRQSDRIDIPPLQALLRLGLTQGPEDWADGAKIFSDGSYTTEGLNPYFILNT